MILPLKIPNVRGCRATRIRPRGQGFQPNGGDGVKVGSNRVQEINLLTISPQWRWVSIHKVSEFPGCGRQAAEVEFLFVRRVAADRANAY
jgi:hypothetical protein